jgi:HAD superfamily hydrolase (TIGR01549 family)
MKIPHPQRFERLPDAILFDIDNTLYAYEPAHAGAMQAVREKVSRTLSIDAITFEKAFNQARSEVKARLQHTASSHSRLLYMQRMLENIGLGSQMFLALDLEQTYWRTFLGNAVLFDDAKELLDDLRLMGIPTAAATDLTAQIQFRKLVYFGLDRYFDFIVTSEEAGHDKPHEAPFRMALEKLRPRGDCIWMIGDNPVNDIQGARTAIGAVTLQKLHEGVEPGTSHNAPDAAFHSFAELRKLLASIESAVKRPTNQADVKPERRYAVAGR